MSFDSLPLFVETVESTNTWLQENLQLESGSVVFTLNQTKGRGRLGREWKGFPGDTLAVSLLVDSPPPSIPATWLPLLAGIAARETLANLGLEKVCLKWPNDLLVDDLKLSGILVEGTIDGRAVMGWGLNLRNPPIASGLLKATALSNYGIEMFDILSGLVVPWRENVMDFLQDQADDSMQRIKSWKSKYLSQLSTLGKTIRVQNQGTEIVGIATSIADDGGLILEYGNKSEPLTIHAGDVFHIERS